MKETCDCYEQMNTTYCSMPLTLHVCNGTKERSECSCNGDEAKCNFYPEKRKKANNELNTAEMWLAAQKDGETYVTNFRNTSYQKDKGFLINDEYKYSDTPSLAEWMNKMWKKQEKRKLTKEQAEKEFDIKIVD